MTWKKQSTGNPYTPYLSLTVGEESLLDGWGLVSFQSTRATSTVLSSCSFELFSADWSQMEARMYDILLQVTLGLKPKPVLQYGYLEGDKSPQYQLDGLSEVKPRYTPEGIYLSLKCIGLGFSMMAEQNPIDCLGEKAKDVSFEGMSISDIVYDVVTKYLPTPVSWNVIDILPTRPVYDVNKTDGSLQLFSLQGCGSVMEFLGKLASEAVSLDGFRGYVIYYDISKGIFQFKPKQLMLRGDNIREYLVFKDRFGDVISFEPDVNMLAYLSSLGGSTAVTLDPNTGEVHQINIALADAFRGGVAEDRKGGLVNLQVDVAGERRVLPGMSVDRAQDIMLNLVEHDKLFDGLTATLSVIGDPLISMDTTVFVKLVDTAAMRKHSLSGAFMVTSVEDSLGTDGFTSNISLVRGLLPSSASSSESTEAQKTLEFNTT